MSRDGSRRAAKCLARARKRQRAHEAERRRAEREPWSFVGSMDGAPDDQLHGPDRADDWHTVAIPVAPDHATLVKFCDALAAHAGPEFEWKKWNGGRGGRRRDAYQRLFMRAFVAALDTVPDVNMFVYASQERTIAKAAEGFYQEVDRARPGLLRRRGDLVDVGPTSLQMNQSAWPLDFTTTWWRMAVVLWTASCLANIYRLAASDIGRKPHWDLICDRFPGDSRACAIALLTLIMAVLGRDRIKLRVMQTEKKTRPELLADCIASWGYAFLTDETSAAGRALQAIFDHPQHSNRWQLQRYIDG